MLLIGRKKCRDPTIWVEGKQVEIRRSAVYLGVTLDRRLTGTEHVRAASAKALKTANAIARLMPEAGAPQKRPGDSTPRWQNP